MKVKIKNNFTEGFSRLNILANVINKFDLYSTHNNVMFEEQFYTQYLMAANKDLEDMVQNFAKEAQIFSGSWMLAEYKIINDLRFSAYSSINKNGMPQYCISLGVLLTLDDLFFRCLSEKRFFISNVKNNFNEDIPDRDCMWVGNFGLLQPNIRYYDYHIVEAPDILIANAARGRIPDISFASALFNALPVSEPEKFEIAGSMTQIAISWIILHEEMHYLEGHLHFLKEHLSNSKGISETGNQFEGQNLKTLSRLMEWQADKYAAHGIIDVFLELTNLLPKQFTKNGYDAFNTIRLIMTSIGCITLVFEKINLINGVSDEYPNTRTRLRTILVACITRIKQSALYKSGIIEEDDITKAYFHSLFDVMAGSIVLPKFDTIKDKIKYFNHPVNENPKQNLELIKNLDELFRVFSVTFYNKIEDEEDKKIADKWLSEQIELFTANDSFFLQTMKEFGEKAMSDLHKRNEEIKTELNILKKIFK